MRIKFLKRWRSFKADQLEDIADGMANVLIRRGIAAEFPLPPGVDPVPGREVDLDGEDAPKPDPDPEPEAKVPEQPPEKPEPPPNRETRDGSPKPLRPPNRTKPLTPEELAAAAKAKTAKKKPKAKPKQ